MLRSVVPRLSGQARQVSRHLKGVGAVNKAQPSRAFGDRWLPVRRPHRGSWVDDLFHRPWPRDMFDHMRRMDRLMDDVMRWPRWAERGEYDLGHSFGQGKVLVVKEDGCFKVKVDVGEYNPEGLSVKTSGEKLVIRAESTKDAGKMVSTREISIAIPEEVEAETFESLLAEDGVLTVSARMKEAPPPEEKIIDIKQEPKKEDKQEPKKEDK